MLQIDVNVLVNAGHTDAPEHQRYAAWLDELVNSPQPFAVSELVLSAFVRVMMQLTKRDPEPRMPRFLDFSDTLRSRPRCVVVRPGPRQWEIFRSLCLVPGITAGHVSDAYHAATAIEYGHEWVSDDADFGRFPGLRWRRPFD